MPSRQSSLRSLTGWGRTAATFASVVQPQSAAQVGDLLRSAPPRGIVARGLGSSYGDAAQNGGGTVAQLAGLDGIGAIDQARGSLRVQAGVSLDRLIRALLPQGWFVPVSPGTRNVTVGGAVAADIHGKNHHRDGSFCMHLEDIELLTPMGRMVVGPRDDPEVFWASCGGMGLTGIIVEVGLRLLPVETSLVSVDTDRAADLDAVMGMMAEGDHQYRYSVAWIDCLARGANMGRAVLTRGDHATRDQLPSEQRGDPLRFSPGPRVPTPPLVPPGLVNRLSIGAFNEAWFRRAPRRQRGHLESLASFFHPLDRVTGWNRLYGPRGFLQYQVALPFGAEATVRHLVESFSDARTPSFLAVLKRFGEGSPGHLSFPSPGWTLALDMPAGLDGLARTLDRMDELVANAGGRVYLAKDSRMRPEMVPRMYPRLEEWRAVRARVDPRGVLQSDLSRRLRLTAA